MQLETRHCTLCGPHAPKRVKYPATVTHDDLNPVVFSARRSPDKRHFQMVECTDCGMVYSDPACDPTSLAVLYDKASVNYDSQEGQIYQSYAPILDRALKLLPLDKRRTFVEIGGGRGFMLRYGVEKHFAEQIEIEPSKDAALRFEPPAPTARFLHGIFRSDTLAPGSASLICSFQVLDHIPNPRQLMNDVFAALQPGGVVVMVTHNTKAVSARLLGERSPIVDVEHTFLFNKRNIASLCKKAGFTDVESFSVPNRYALRYWLNLAPMPNAVRRFAQRVLHTLHLSDLQVSLYAGNLACVARKPI